MQVLSVDSTGIASVLHGPHCKGINELHDSTAFAWLQFEARETNQLTLTFAGEEQSDWLNFVLKDGDSWYDNKGTNFHVPLRADGATLAEPERQKQVRLKPRTTTSS